MMTMNLAAFAKWAVQDGPFEGSHLDGWDVQDKAVEFGILTIVKFDPDIHRDDEYGADAGDDWYVFSDEFKAALLTGTE